ncbi:MAG: hypothetical protein AB1558_04090 [Thermodesulfobacteriota bacterium]
MMWLVIITFITGILAAALGLGGGAIDFIEKYYGYRDDSYRPMDTERYEYEAAKEQSKP